MSTTKNSVKKTFGATLVQVDFVTIYTLVVGKCRPMNIYCLIFCWLWISSSKFCFSGYLPMWKLPLSQGSVDSKILGGRIMRYISLFLVPQRMRLAQWVKGNAYIDYSLSLVPLLLLLVLAGYLCRDWPNKITNLGT